MPEGQKKEERHYPCRKSSVPRMRRAAVEILGSWGLQALAEDAELCVSELAGNAVRHASERRDARQMGLVMEVTDAGRLRVEVHDAWGGVPRVRRVEPDAESGRGMVVVAGLAEDWGVAPRHGSGAAGKAVWFELALSNDASTAAGCYTGPNIGVTATGDAAYPYRLDFVPLGRADDRPRDVSVTTSQAMTLVSRLAPLLGLELGPVRNGLSPGC